MRIGRALALLVAARAIAVSAQNRPAPARTEIAPGIVLVATPPYGDVGLDGNSIAILSSEGALVFNTNGTPAASAAAVAQPFRAARWASDGSTQRTTGVN